MQYKQFTLAYKALPCICKFTFFSLSRFFFLFEFETDVKLCNYCKHIFCDTLLMILKHLSRKRNVIIIVKNKYPAVHKVVGIFFLLIHFYGDFSRNFLNAILSFPFLSKFLCISRQTDKQTKKTSS